MLYNETYRKYFDNHGLKNIFKPLLEIGDFKTENWIAKSAEEINRFANYIILINKYEKEPIDNFTITAIHESLTASSVSIAFCIFNIFAIITDTEASFFDDHIKDFFKNKTTLNSEEMNLLSFKWHSYIQSINSLSYSIDEKLSVYKRDSIIGFKILKLNNKELSNKTLESNENGMIHSKFFFSIHLLYLLSTIELIINLLLEEKCNPRMTVANRKSSYLAIENVPELITIYKESL
jgi:hypothetical protein